MQVSIIGLGWLGEPLAVFLQEKGYSVKGSTTSLKKAELLSGKGLNAALLLFNPLAEGGGKETLFNTDLLIINIPPQIKTRPVGFHLHQLRAIRELAEINHIPKIIYISTTSVYPDLGQVAVESDKLRVGNVGNMAILQAENLLWKDKTYDLTILRMGGLLGDDRIPGKYFSGKALVPGHPPVNYIYRNDAVRMIHWVMEKQLWNQTFNGVSPLHPTKKEIYEKNALDLGFPPPLSYELPALSSWKIVSSAKIGFTGFRFEFAPLEFPYAAKTF